MRNFLQGLTNWTLMAPWRSWLAHALVAIPLCFLVGPLAAMTVYFFREGEQIFFSWVYHSYTFAPEPHDRFFDVLAPMAVAVWWDILQLPVLVG